MMTGPAELEATKAALRSGLLQRRCALTSEWVRSHSAAIAERVRGLAVYQRARRVGLYVAARGEVCTKALIDECLALNREVWLPRYRKENRTYGFCCLTERGLRAGPLGIFEPIPDDAQDDATMDVVFVPGVAFSTDGTRIGHGAGWYDRMLSRISIDIPKIGLAYSWQVFSELPCADHDVRMDGVVTEDKVLGRSSAFGEFLRDEYE